MARQARDRFEVSTSDLRTRFWRDLTAANLVIRGVLIGTILLGAVLWHLFDPFGFGAASAQRASDLMRRIYTPWWGAYGWGWHVPTHIDPTTVVLFQRQKGAPWPPDYEDQANTLEYILGQCPAVVAIDLFYDTPRDKVFDLDALMRAVLQAPDACPTQARIVLGDHVSHRPAACLLPPLRTMLDGGVKTGEPCTLDAPPAADRPGPVWTGGAPLGGKDIALHGKIAAQVMLGVAQWTVALDDADSAFEGADQERLYVPFSRWEDAPSGVPGRPSLALQAYLAWCTGPEGVRDDQCPRQVRDAATAHLGDAGGRAARAVAAADRVAKLFDRPVDLMWPRWGPKQLADFWKNPNSPVADTAPRSEDREQLLFDMAWVVEDLFGPPVCTYKSETFWGRRLWESLRLFAHSLAQSERVFTSRETGLDCFPLMTFTQNHINLYVGHGEKPDSIDSHEFHRLQRDVPGHIAGRVVFVGFDDAGSADAITTPLHRRLPGVFAHAMAFENFARMGDKYLSVPGTKIVEPFRLPVSWADVIEVVLSTIIGVAVFAYLRLRWRRRHWAKLLRRLDQHLVVRDGSKFGDLRLFWSGILHETVRGLSVLGIVVGVIFLCSLVTTFWFRWSGVNWFEVTILALLPLYLLAPKGLRAKKSGAASTTFPSQPRTDTEPA